MLTLSLADKTGLIHPGVDMPVPPPVRRQRPRPEPVPVTASLVWTSAYFGECELQTSECFQLHAEVELAEGGVVRHKTDNPAQSITWKDPMAGDYSITVKPSPNSEFDFPDMSYRVLLKVGNREPFEVESAMQDEVSQQKCFVFRVAEGAPMRMLNAPPGSSKVEDEYATPLKATLVKAEC